jgi:hypothetical protein
VKVEITNVSIEGQSLPIDPFVVDTDPALDIQDIAAAAMKQVSFKTLPSQAPSVDIEVVWWEFGDGRVEAK